MLPIIICRNMTIIEKLIKLEINLFLVIPLVQNISNSLFLSYLINSKGSSINKLFSNLILQQPDYIEAWNKRATIRFMMGQLDASLEDVFVVLSKEPKHFGAVSGLAMILMREKNFGGALQAYRKVLQIHPFSRDALRLIPILEQRILGERI